MFDGKGMSKVIEKQAFKFCISNVRVGETTFYSFLKKQYSLKRGIKGKDFFLDKLIEKAQELKSSYLSYPLIDLLIASLYLFRGSKVSACLYANLITIEQFQALLKTETDKSEANFMRLLAFFVLTLLSSECYQKGDFKLGKTYAELAISATPSECNVLLYVLELLGDQLCATSEISNALEVYDQILSHLPELATEKKKPVQRQSFEVSEINSPNPMLSTVSSTSYLNECFDVQWPDLFGRQGWIPDILAETIKFETNSFIQIILKASNLCFHRDSSQLMNLMKYLRLGYSIENSNPVILLKLADVGFLLSIEDLEAYYVNALESILPSFTELQELVSADPLLVKQADLEEKKCFLQQIPPCFKNNTKLLAECLLVVARSHLKHQQYFKAKPLLFGIACLIGLESNLEHGYEYPNTAKICNAFKHTFFRMMIKWAYASRMNEYTFKFGNYLLSSGGLNPEVLVLLADILTEKGNLEEALLRYKLAFSQFRQKQLSSTTSHEIMSKAQIPLPFQTLLPSDYTYIFSLTDMRQAPWFFLFDFVMDLSLSDAELEVFLAERMLNIAKHPLIKDLETQKEALQILCTQNPLSNEYRYQLARVFEKQNKINESKILYIRVLNVDPHHVDASIRLALIYYHKKKYNEAYEVLTQMEKFDIPNVLYYELYSRVCLDLNPMRIEQAVRLLKQAIQLEPLFVKAIYKLGLIHYSCLKNITSAKIFMKQVIDLSERVVGHEQRLQAALGSAEFNTSDTTENNKQCSLDYKRDQLNHIKSYAALVLSEILLFEGRIDSCDTIMAKVCDSLKTKHRFVILSARIKYAMCQFNGTLELLKPTLDSTLTDFSTELLEAYNLAAQAYERLNLLKKAQNAAIKACELNPRSVSALVTRAWIISRLDSCHLDEAIRLSLDAENIDSNSPLPHLYLGYFYFLKRQIEQAITHLEIASDRIEYAWTYSVASRFNCPQSYIVLCKIYLLLCWYIRIRQVYVDDEFPVSIKLLRMMHFFSEPKRLEKFTDVLNNVEVFNCFFERHKGSAASIFTIIIEKFEKDIQEHLNQRFLLQTNDWKYVKELFLAYACWMGQEASSQIDAETLKKDYTLKLCEKKETNLPTFPLNSKVKSFSVENSERLLNTKYEAYTQDVVQTQYSYEVMNSKNIQVITENESLNNISSVLSLPPTWNLVATQKIVEAEKQEQEVFIGNSSSSLTKTSNLPRSQLTLTSSISFINTLQKSDSNSIIEVRRKISTPISSFEIKSDKLNIVTDKTKKNHSKCSYKYISTKTSSVEQISNTQVLSTLLSTSKNCQDATTLQSVSTRTYMKRPTIIFPTKSLLCGKQIDEQNIMKAPNFQVTNELVRTDQAHRFETRIHKKSQDTEPHTTVVRAIKTKTEKSKFYSTGYREKHCCKSEQMCKRSATVPKLPEAEKMIMKPNKLTAAAKESAIRQKLVALGVPSNKIFAYEDIVLKKCLGKGGFGAVYSGTLKNTGQAVAIKHLHLKLSSDALIQWYDALSEIQAVFYLQHSSLIEFVGLSLRKTNLYIITELCSKGSLYHQLHTSKNSTLPSTWCIRHKIALQIVNGLKFLHSLKPKVIHRDLKSLNIVLDEKWNAKICDFGLTTSMNIMKSHLSLVEGANGGSPRYMAPECYRASGVITEKVDIWSLGCILIEIFGGPIPYHKCQRFEQIIQKLLIEKQIPEIHSSFPVQLQVILKGCLQFAPAARWSAEKVYQYLQVLPEFKIVNQNTK